MDRIFIPTEQDFRRWIREALEEYFKNAGTLPKQQDTAPGEEPLLCRKEIAGIFRISLVTLHAWMNRGLPYHKQGGRDYFLRSEVLDYLKRKRIRHKAIPEDGTK